MTVESAAVRPSEAEDGVLGRFDRDKDEAIAMVGDQQNEIDPVTAARAVRKTDWFLIPAMIVGCTFQKSSFTF